MPLAMLQKMESLAENEEDSDSDSIRQEMEEALYAQIHFEQNTEVCVVDTNDEDDKLFSVKVEGNSPAGFKAKKTTADIILNRSIGQADDDDEENDEDDKNDDEGLDELRRRKRLERIFDRSDGDFGDFDVELMDLDSDLDSLYGVLDQEGGENSGIQLNVIAKKKHRPLLDAKISEGDKWKINVEDVHQRRSIGRYHKGFNKGFRCHNCDEEGHLSKNCPKPKKEKVCGFCSEPGHFMLKCPNSFCYNCSGAGHDARSCPSPKKNPFARCHRCRLAGHEQRDCPDLWRQFHKTISPGKLVQGKRKKQFPIYCYNCAGDDHLGHDCYEGRMYKHVRVASPFVCRYDRLAQPYGMDREGPEEPPHKKQRSDTELNTARKLSCFLIGKHRGMEGNTGRSNFDKLQFDMAKSPANAQQKSKKKDKVQDLKIIVTVDDNVPSNNESGISKDIQNRNDGSKKSLGHSGDYSKPVQNFKESVDATLNKAQAQTEIDLTGKCKKKISKVPFPKASVDLCDDTEDFPRNQTSTLNHNQSQVSYSSTKGSRKQPNKHIVFQDTDSFSSMRGKGKGQNKHIKFQDTDSFKSKRVGKKSFVTSNNGFRTRFVSDIATEISISVNCDDSSRDVSHKEAIQTVDKKDDQTEGDTQMVDKSTSKPSRRSKKRKKAQELKATESDIKESSVPNEIATDEMAKQTAKKKEKKEKKRTKKEMRLAAEMMEQEPEEFLNHQVHDNEWWKKGKKRKRPKKKKKGTDA